MVPYPKEEAERLRGEIRGPVTLSILEHLFAHRCPPGQTEPIWRCPAEISYNLSGVPTGGLAFAKPNRDRDWTRYTVHVDPRLRTSVPDLMAVLAHELYHVMAGQFASEADCDQFSENLLGLDSGHLDAIRSRYRGEEH